MTQRLMITKTTTFSAAKANLAALLDQVGDGQRIVVIERHNAPNVAMISAKELSGLLETIHLLRSPANAQRLHSALSRVKHECDSSSSRR
jgi:antitoxin YefM